MVRQPVPIAWWLRIVAVIGAFLAVLPVAAMLANVDSSGIVAFTLPYAWLLAVSLFIEHRRGGSHVTLGLPFRPLATHGTVKGALLALAALAVVVGTAVALGAQWTPVASTSGMGVVLLSVMLTVVLASGEELLFRGMIFQALQERFGAIVAILATSVPFGLAHAANPDASTLSVVNTVLAGITLGAMVAVYRSLWMAIGFHGAWNLGVAAGIGPLSGWDELPYRVAMLDTTMLHDWRWLVDGPYGIEEGAVTAVVLTAVTIAVLRSTRYDAYVEAARQRRALLQDSVPCTPTYTGERPSTSDHGVVSP